MKWIGNSSCFARKSIKMAQQPFVHGELQGLAEVQAALKSVDILLRSAVLTAALRKQMSRVITTARTLAPVDTGTLRRSLAVRTARRNNRTTFFAWGGIRSGMTNNSATYLSTGRGRKNPRLVAIYGGAQEFGFFAGTQGATVTRSKKRRYYSKGRFIPPQPFMRPAWAMHVGGIPQNLGLDMEPQIKKAVARHARKKRSVIK